MEVAGWGKTENGIHMAIWFIYLITFISIYFFSQFRSAILNLRSKFLVYRMNDATQYIADTVSHWERVNCVLVELKVQIAVVETVVDRLVDSKIFAKKIFQYFVSTVDDR